MKTRPNCIIIMDGYGINPSVNGNAIIADGSKYVNELKDNYPSAQLGASGMSVGLPDGQMGNSEVGHLNIGAGRVVYQELARISKSIEDGDFFSKNEFVEAGIDASDEQIHKIIMEQNIWRGIIYRTWMQKTETSDKHTS